MSSGFQEYLIEWFQKEKNRCFYQEEVQLLNRCLPNLFGFFLVQLGRISNENICSASRVNHKVLVDYKLPPADVSFLEVQKVQADLDYLPIGKDCVDVLVLPHTLEVAADPHYLLRQADAMLIPEGHLVITGFVPAGYISWSQGWRTPWISKNDSRVHVNLESPKKIKEWLKVLGYDIQSVHFTSIGVSRQQANYSQLSFSAKWISTGFRLFQKLLKIFGVSIGNSYCLVAKKRVDSPTLVGLKWQMPRWKAVTGKLASRSSVSNRDSRH
ncbi:methyltransferase domain-containing protein [Thiomicrorhabdus indica]|uniref:methyltransferase domain-containing protein n=1 Tax=Thiomicrorhabdus indica TaxID=2267253 RepID=UPI00102D797C|nr:methyltransferase domain-containing protein [Thiomicrorhabdus indica]